MLRNPPCVVTAQTDRSGWIHGSEALCRGIAPGPRHQPCRLLLLGAPGAGKDSLAESLQDVLGICALTMADIFHAARSYPAEWHSPALRSALELAEKGANVPGELMLELIRERGGCVRCRGGFLLEGFPRTVAEAEGLDELMRAQRVTLDAVIDLVVQAQTVIDRLGSQRTCPICRAVYRPGTRPPRRPGWCNLCHAALIQRDEDRPEAIRARLEAYATDSAPLLDYYRRHGRLVAVPADGTAEETLSHTLNALSHRAEPPT